MSNKSIRQIKIREIITNSKVETQEDLVERLNEYNSHVTQATVSRISRNSSSSKCRRRAAPMSTACQKIGSSTLWKNWAGISWTAS